MKSFGLHSNFYSFFFYFRQLIFSVMSKAHRPSLTAASGAMQSLVKDHSADSGGPVRVIVNTWCRHEVAIEEWKNIYKKT